ncbi:MAG TPA: class I SAM-dependent methyltransferase [Devosiaceae bacterium]|nr:class I SAM-dependent methyltransferase [Devosiaceae bacterium]
MTKAVRPAVMGGADPATLRFYSEEAEVYVAGGPGGVSRRLVGFLEMLQPGARILELGCGGGRDAEAMIAAGFEVDPTDGSAAIARKAEARLGRTVRVMQFAELDAVASYDAVWANASLLHVPREALPAILALVFRALKPGGLHFGSYKGGGIEGRDAYGRYFNYLSQAELVGMYERSAPWQVVDVAEFVGGGYDGLQGPWIAITARRGG